MIGRRGFLGALAGLVAVARLPKVADVVTLDAAHRNAAAAYAGSRRTTVDELASILKRSYARECFVPPRPDEPWEFDE